MYFTKEMPDGIFQIFIYLFSVPSILMTLIPAVLKFNLIHRLPLPALARRRRLSEGALLYEGFHDDPSSSQNCTLHTSKYIRRS